jgi:hypothetical protein
MTIVQENKVKVATFVVLILTNIFIIIDIFSDIREGVPLSHLVHELALWFFSIMAAVFQYKIIRWQFQKIKNITEQVNELGKLNSKLLDEKKRVSIAHLKFQRRVPKINRCPVRKMVF